MMFYLYEQYFVYSAVHGMLLTIVMAIVTFIYKRFMSFRSLI